MADVDLFKTIMHVLCSSRMMGDTSYGLGLEIESYEGQFHTKPTLEDHDILRFIYQIVGTTFGGGDLHVRILFSTESNQAALLITIEPNNID